MKELREEFIVIEPQRLYPGGKALKADNKNISENKNKNVPDTWSHFRKSKKGYH